MQIQSIQKINYNSIKRSPNFQNKYKNRYYIIKENFANNDFSQKSFFCLIGIGAIIFTCIKLLKNRSILNRQNISSEIKEAQNLYNEIFNKNVSIDEIKEIANRYKKIIDTPQKSEQEYCETLLHEICNNRNVPTPRIRSFITNAKDASVQGGYMSTSPDGSYLDIYAFNYKNSQNSAKEYFCSLFHETRHVKQDEMIYRTDKEFFLQLLEKKFIGSSMYKELLLKNGGDKTKTLEEIRQRLTAQVDRHWGHFEPYSKDSAEYKEGLKLIEGKKNYKPFFECESLKEYKNQIIEKEAYDDGAKAEKFFDLLKKL